MEIRNHFICSWEWCLQGYLFSNHLPPTDFVSTQMKRTEPAKTNHVCKSDKVKKTVNAARKQLDYWAKGCLKKALHWTIFWAQTLFKSSSYSLQVLYEDGEEHNFCVFLFHTLKKQIFDGGNQMKLRVNQQTVDVEAEWCIVQLAPAGTVFTPRFNNRQARHFLVMQIFHRLTFC